MWVAEVCKLPKLAKKLKVQLEKIAFSISGNEWWPFFTNRPGISQSFVHVYHDLTRADFKGLHRKSCWYPSGRERLQNHVSLDSSRAHQTPQVRRFSCSCLFFFWIKTVWDCSSLSQEWSRSLKDQGDLRCFQRPSKGWLMLIFMSLSSGEQWTAVLCIAGLQATPLKEQLISCLLNIV